MLVTFRIGNGCPDVSTDQLIVLVMGKDQVVFDFLEQKLDKCKPFQDEEKRPRMLINLHNIFLRSEITEPELNTLYGIINYLSGKED